MQGDTRLVWMTPLFDITGVQGEEVVVVGTVERSRLMMYTYLEFIGLARGEGLKHSPGILRLVGHFKRQRGHREGWHYVGYIDCCM